MTVVVDASVVVAMLVDTGEVGRWAETVLADGSAMGPNLMPAGWQHPPRAELAGHISADTAALAHADLLAWPVALFPYSPFAARIWELRPNLTAYDASYVALAEHLGAPLPPWTGGWRLCRGPAADSPCRRMRADDDA